MLGVRAWWLSNGVPSWGELAAWRPCELRGGGAAHFWEATGPASSRGVGFPIGCGVDSDGLCPCDGQDRSCDSGEPGVDDVQGAVIARDACMRFGDGLVLWPGVACG